MSRSLGWIVLGAVALSLAAAPAAAGASTLDEDPDSFLCIMFPEIFCPPPVVVEPTPTPTPVPTASSAPVVSPPADATLAQRSAPLATATGEASGTTQQVPSPATSLGPATAVTRDAMPSESDAPVAARFTTSNRIGAPAVLAPAASPTLPDWMLAVPAGVSVLLGAGALVSWRGAGRTTEKGPVRSA